MIIVTALYLRRDRVARELANSALSDTNFAVSELSVRSMGVSHIEFSRLVVISENGSRFDIRGLSVPYGAESNGVTRINAESLEVEFGPDRTPRERFSDTIWELLALPGELRDTSVSVGMVRLPQAPVIQEAVWTSIGSRQNARFEADGHAIEIIVYGDAVDGYRISVLASDDEIAAELDTAAIDDLLELRGEIQVRIDDWLPTLRTLDLLPEAVAGLETQLSGNMAIAFDREQPGDIVVEASLASSDATAMQYAVAADTNVMFDVVDSETLNVQFEYPAMTWSARSSGIDSLVAIEDGTFPLLLNNLECRSGIRCTMYATVYGESLSWADYAVDTASIASPIVVEIGEVTSIDLPAEASVLLTGIRVGEIAAASAEVRAFSGASVTVAEEWETAVDSLTLVFDGLEVAEQLSASGELAFSGLVVSESGATVESELSLAAGATAVWNDLLISLPGLTGTMTRDGDELRTSLTVRDPAIEAGIDLVRNFDTGAGAVSVRGARVSFDYAHLSDYVREWPFVWDVMSGALTFDAQLDWQSRDTGTRYYGDVAVDLQKLSGVYDDYAFVGVTTALKGTVDSAEGIDLEPGSVSVPLIDVGLPVENVAANYRIDVGAGEVSIEDLSLEAFGGRITAEPFTYSAGADSNQILFSAEAIQLALIADVADFDAVDMSGSISGQIPVTIGADSIGIDSGQLASDDPGGVIRYSSGVAADAAPEGNLNIVTRALSNFEFDTLTSNVDYDSDGDLVLTMRLSGINPDMNPNQPIILNLNVENNVPQMLRSLRAIRSIEDILQERTAE